MFVEVAKIGDIAPGGMKAVEAGGEEVVLCNYGGRIYALNRRCGHMNAPLDMGTLEGYILTCPMHDAQFDITTGEALSGPVPHDPGNEMPPKGLLDYLTYISTLMSKIRTCSVKTYPVRIDGGIIKIDTGKAAQ